MKVYQALIGFKIKICGPDEEPTAVEVMDEMVYMINGKRIQPVVFQVESLGERSRVVVDASEDPSGKDLQLKEKGVD